MVAVVGLTAACPQTTGEADAGDGDGDGDGDADAGWPDAHPGGPDAGAPDAAVDPYDYPADYEAPVQILPLDAPADDANWEYSGLAWYGDTLVLLPQLANGVWTVQRADIEAHIAGTGNGPLPVQAVLFDPAPGPDNVPNFDGLEAIAFDGDTVYVSIETSGPQGGGGYLVRGQVAPGLASIDIDLSTLTLNPSPVPAEANSAFEAMVLTDDAVVTFFELNGFFTNPNADASVFDRDLNPVAARAFPELEYRVTDATALDDSGRFWVINYYYPGAGRPVKSPEPLAATYGEGATHAQFQQVERLVELELAGDNIVRVDRPPLQLQLIGSWQNDLARNWEGIVRLGDQGFLVVTDLFPASLLGFVPLP